MEEKEYVA
ncbi:Protein of unknown function [Bacillus cereus]|nr:Protein of unknown function [Bacillus cereus]